jgi:hypothetical protein
MISKIIGLFCGQTYQESSDVFHQGFDLAPAAHSTPPISFWCQPWRLADGSIFLLSRRSTLIEKKAASNVKFAETGVFIGVTE